MFDIFDSVAALRVEQIHSRVVIALPVVFIHGENEAADWLVINRALSPYPREFTLSL